MRETLSLSVCVCVYVWVGIFVEHVKLAEVVKILCSVCIFALPRLSPLKLATLTMTATATVTATVTVTPTATSTVTAIFPVTEYRMFNKRKTKTLQKRKKIKQTSF